MMTNEHRPGRLVAVWNAGAIQRAKAFLAAEPRWVSSCPALTLPRRIVLQVAGGAK